MSETTRRRTSWSARGKVAGHWFQALILLLALGFALRLALALRPLDTVDRLFIPDDTYYTLSIARSMAAGYGPSVDAPAAVGHVLTNGFQPLWAFLLVPVFLLVHGTDAPLRMALLLSALFGVVSAALLARLAWRLAGRGASLFAAALWSFSAVAVSNELGGLETALALAAALAVVETWCGARERPGPQRYALLGAFCGLALLARIDAAFLVALVGIVELLGRDYRGRHPHDRAGTADERGRRTIGETLLIPAVALLVVAPWWGYSFVKFHTVIPESGAAVAQQVGFHRSAYLTLPKQIAWGLGSLIGPPFLELKKAKELLFLHAPIATAAAVLLTAGFTIVIGRALRSHPLRAPMGALIAFGLLLAAFYVLALPALWFFRRYLHPSYAVITLLLAWGLSRLWRDRTRLHAKILLAAGALCLAASLARVGSYLVMDPPTTPDQALHGAKGYRETARDILRLLPEGSILGGFQSGALGYYAGTGVRVINLDGVVNPEAARAIRERSLGECARRMGVTYFADWEINYKALGYFGGDVVRNARFEVLGDARSQGPDHFRLSRINWPER